MERTISQRWNEVSLPPNSYKETKDPEGVKVALEWIKEFMDSTNS